MSHNNFSTHSHRSKLPMKQTTTLKNYFEFSINDFSMNKRFKDNTIDQSKYNIITFLPKAILFQFLRFANIYFLIIAIIQSIPAISPFGQATATIPLAFVIGISLIREAFEDLRRHHLDNQQNNEKVNIYKEGKWVQDISKHLRMGEIILIIQEQQLPADVIVLDSFLPDGKCYLETATLDGEKTLKQKISSRETAGLFHDSEGLKEKFTINGVCKQETKNPNLYDHSGAVDLTINGIYKRFPIDAKQLLLKGATLKNTRWAIGFVCFTGHSTKLIMNSKMPKQKYSKLEIIMSYMILVIFCCQILLCLSAAIGFGILNSQAYIMATGYIPASESIVFDSFLNYFTYTLLLNTMIPISLIVTLEMCKAVQGYFLNRDVEMYSFVRKK